VSGGRKVSSAARDAVTVMQGNVLDAFLVPAASKFDVIFCRNLLIYLDTAARARALDNLCLWLAPDGILFGGHAEAIDAMDPRFQHLNDAGHCAYVRRRTVALPSQPSQPAVSARNVLPHRTPGPVPASAHSGPVRIVPARVAPSQAKAALEKPVPVKSVASARPSVSLEEVTALANRGDPAAAAACERHIAEAGASAEAYCLLGVIRNAAGAEQAAIESFNRALYLDQSHYASLVHLALLHERRGDLTATSNFRRRAERIQRKQGTK
jgi:chemotaxis protein methyltransferase WspC